MAGDSDRILQQALLGEAVLGMEGAAVFVWNEERHYVAVNDEACRLVGLSRAELIGTPVGNLSPDGAANDIEETSPRGADATTTLGQPGTST